MTPADAFLVTLRRLEEGQPLDADLAQWLAAGFRDFAQGKARTLEQALQIDGGSGGAHFRLNKAIPQALLADALKRLEKALAAHFGGTRNALAHLIAAGLVDAEACDGWPAAALHAIQQIKRHHPSCPTSGKQIGRILKGETAAYRMDIKPGLYVPAGTTPRLNPHNKFTGVKPMNLPNKQARRQLVAQHMEDAGIDTVRAHAVAALVPDIFMVKALTASKELQLELANNRLAFLLYGDSRVFLGYVHDFGGFSRAAGFWLDAEIQSMSDTPAAAFDLDSNLKEYSASKWRGEFESREYPECLLTVDIVRSLREFGGTA